MEEAWEFAALAMPVWLRYKGWIFTVPAGDTTNRPHVHIVREGKELKVWLYPVETARNTRVSAKDERALLRKVRDEQVALMERWNEQFG